MSVIRYLLPLVAFSCQAAQLALPADRVRLQAYTPIWSVIYHKEAKTISENLEKSNLVAIEHFGSTSIPGMVAKPVIDILVGIKNFFLTSQDFQRLSDMGYEFKEKSPYCERYYFHKRDMVNVNLSIAPFESETWKRCIAIRDYLRAHDDAKEDYINIKLEALSMGKSSIEEYSRHKQGFIEELNRRAMQWRYDE